MGIRGKLILATLSVAFVVGAALILYAMTEMRRAVTNEVGHRVETVAGQLVDELSERAVALHSINDAVAVKSVLEELDVVAAYALDPQGWILSDGSSRTFNQDERPTQFQLIRPLLANLNSGSRVEDGSGIHVIQPVFADDEHFGFVHVIAGKTRVGTVTDRALANLGMLFGVLIVIGVLGSFLTASLVCRPIRWMLDGTNAMKRGNFKVRLPVKSRDELGKLAESINDMATGLRATTVSKRYLDEVLQSMADSLIVVDTDATIVTVNRATLELLGYDENGVVGQPASLVCIDEGYQLTGARLAHLLGTQSQQDYELVYRTAGGDMVPISFSGSPIRDNSGETVGYVCIGKDIRERKTVEAERERLNKKLVDTSRRAGMAEVATGVLHNVGNVLNSVNISASMLADTVRRSKLAGLSKAVSLLNEHDGSLGSFIENDDKGKRIPRYLSEVTQHLSDEQTSMLEELDSLTHNINHIKDIISMQQSYSKVTGVIEPLKISDVVEEALRMNEASLDAHRVKVVRDFDEVPIVKSDKHKALQILVNLITNAKDAMDAVPEEQRKLTLNLAVEDSMVNIDVQDAGTGIPKENLTRIFTHGFTTKKKGNGFGLHSAALTAKELGGSLLVHSDGVDKGAVFRLSLPLETVGAKA